jgi:hypothetical protein
MNTKACAIGGRYRCASAQVSACSFSIATPCAVKVVGPHKYVFLVRTVAERTIRRMFHSSPHLDAEDGDSAIEFVVTKSGADWL